MKILLCFLCFFQISVSLSQNFELGNVTVNELKQKQHEKDTSASAAIIFKKAKTIFKHSSEHGFVSYTEVILKIKIYKESGLDRANFKIPYYVGYESIDDESVVISKAFTYNLVNGEVIKEKVTGAGQFDQEVNEFWKKKSIVFPNVKAGSIIELKYVLKSQNLSVLPDFQFQYTIPVNYAEYITEIPEFYIYKSIKNGLVEVDVKESLSNVSLMTGNGYAVFCKQINTKYLAKNVPALSKENFVNNINNYFGKIELELQTVRMPNEIPKQLSTTWEDAVKTIYKEKNFGPELEKMNYFLNDLNVLLIDVKSDEEKLSKIFNFVKNRMTWNGKYSYATKIGVEKAYKERVGNSAEINLILTAMLRIANLQSIPALISTKENGIAMFPNRTRFNHVIGSVKIGENILLLDAINKWSTVNVLPLEDLNWKGRLIDNDGANAEIDLQPSEISKKYVTLMASIDQNAQVAGKVKQLYFNHNAYNFRNKHAGFSKENYFETLENRYETIEIKEHSVENFKESLDNPVTENYMFASNNMVEIIGDKMYFNPMLFFAQSKNPFVQGKREYPVDFVFSNQDKYMINITIPDGYVIETIPSQKAISLPDNLGSFRFNVQKTEKQIQLLVNVDINSSEIPPEYYDALKQFFDEIVNTQTEKVVLKKA